MAHGVDCSSSNTDSAMLTVRWKRRYAPSRSKSTMPAACSREMRLRCILYRPLNAAITDLSSMRSDDRPARCSTSSPMRRLSNLHTASRLRPCISRYSSGLGASGLRRMTSASATSSSSAARRSLRRPARYGASRRSTSDRRSWPTSTFPPAPSMRPTTRPARLLPPPPPLLPPPLLPPPAPPNMRACASASTAANMSSSW